MLPNRIVRNARRGRGPCEGCPTREVHGGSLVNPGLGNPEAELIFVTDEPRHSVDWTQYESWEGYNRDYRRKFAAWRGGELISRLLFQTDLTLDDVWVADSVKCPTSSESKRSSPREAFNHCRTYLRQEIEAIDPKGIVTLGGRATERTLDVLDCAREISVTEDYGTIIREADYPVVVSLHWASRTVRRREWIPAVQIAIAEVLGVKPIIKQVRLLED